ncbi:MAG: hypothetical protein ICV51_09100 [Flavisolibacter sp.]|nr:hypothetical protein [Flavisolibacter sp.]
MKAASINDIKQQLKTLPSSQLMDICLRLARYKKENKELLTYLLFEADDPESYINGIKSEMDEVFSAIHSTNLYLVKKSLRKILRTLTKYIRFTGSKVTEVEVLLYFCKKVKESDISYRKSPALSNMYDRLIKKCKVAVGSLHEDLQYDYKPSLDALQ